MSYKSLHQGCSDLEHYRGTFCNANLILAMARNSPAPLKSPIHL
jgi:hypothetical protein